MVCALLLLLNSTHHVAAVPPLTSRGCRSWKPNHLDLAPPYLVPVRRYTKLTTSGRGIFALRLDRRKAKRSACGRGRGEAGRDCIIGLNSFLLHDRVIWPTNVRAGYDSSHSRSGEATMALPWVVPRDWPLVLLLRPTHLLALCGSGSSCMATSKAPTHRHRMGPYRTATMSSEMSCPVEAEVK